MDLVLLGDRRAPYRWTSQRDSQENPIGLPVGSFGFMLKSVVRNRKYRWTSQRDWQENPIRSPDGSFGFMLKSVVRNPKYRWASQRGKTFWANQPSLLQLGGKQFLAVGRSRQNIVFQMQSNDAGETWSEIKASMLPNPNAGTDAVTLADGRHLLVYNHVPGTPGKWGGVRSPLNIAISNNGQDWKAALGIQTVKSLNRLAINMLA